MLAAPQEDRTKQKEEVVKRTIIAITLALSLLLVSSPVSAAGIEVVDRTGDGVWIDNTWQVEIYPGETKSTMLTLHNTASSSLDVEITYFPDSLDNGNLTFELNESDFTMSKRSYADVTFTVKANGSATPGTYATKLMIRSEEIDEDDDRDISNLRIYDLEVENITEDSVDIVWRTNRASRSELTYWANAEATIKDSDYTRDHLIHLEGLRDDTTYLFEIICKDRNKLKADDEDKFTTLKKEIVPTSTPTPTLTPDPIPEPTFAPEPTPTPTPTSVPLLVPPTAPEEPTSWLLIIALIGIPLVGGIGYWLGQRIRRRREMPK